MQCLYCENWINTLKQICNSCLSIVKTMQECQLQNIKLETVYRERKNIRINEKTLNKWWKNCKHIRYNPYAKA